MRIIPDARRVLTRSYSLWAQILALALTLVGPEMLYVLFGVDLSPYALGYAATGYALFGIFGRFIVQPESIWKNWLWLAVGSAVILLVSFGTARAAVPTEAQTLAIAVPFVEAKEGMRLEAYLDAVGVPTICAGTTRGVKMGMRKTLAECRAVLRAEVAEYRLGWLAYVTAGAQARHLTPHRETAFTSWAINIGIAGAGGSTATRRLNASDIPGACDAITWFNKAGGRVMRGLVIRRGDERDLCMIGVAA